MQKDRDVDIYTEGYIHGYLHIHSLDYGVFKEDYVVPVSIFKSDVF